MTETTAGHAHATHPTAHAAAHAGHDDHAHGPAYYVKIWAILLVLLAVSILGPMVGIQWLTLITAFGIAIVKAYIVASRFIHLNVEKAYVSYFLITALVFISLFFGFVAPDVMKHDGHRWENVAAKAETARAMKAAKEGHGAHGAEHGAALPAHQPAAQPGANQPAEHKATH